jgi:hypothetical protein
MEKSFKDLFAELVERFGDTEEFFVYNETRIGCRAADLSLYKKEDGWHYGQLPEAYPTPTECYAHSREDGAKFHSTVSGSCSSGFDIEAAINQAWEDSGFSGPVSLVFRHGFKEGFAFAEEKLREALGGHKSSELWGESGLIAATMRCVEELQRKEQEQ